jgi:hypothetical protein
MRRRDSCKRPKECTGCASMRGGLPLRVMSVEEEDLGMRDQLREEEIGSWSQVVTRSK